MSGVGLRLGARVRTAARATELLVVCDYDGTLASIVDDPAEAWPNAPAIEALSAIGRLPATHAAIVSGRALRDVRFLTGAPIGVAIFGGHGAEAEGATPAVDAERRKRLDALVSRFRVLAQRYKGARVESKPFSVTFHYRQVDPALHDEAADAAAQLGASFPELRMIPGKCLIEFAGAEADKGTLIASETERLGADVVLFVGDDFTDEDGFDALRPGDVGVKVGGGATNARYRVRDVEAVSALLERLLEERRRVVAGLVPYGRRVGD